MRLAMIAFMQSFSELNTRAGPVIAGFLRPVIFATHPSSARLPLRIARWPSLYIGLDQGGIPSWSARLRGHVLQHFRHRLAVDRHAVAMQHAVLEKDLQYLRHAARAVEIHRYEAPGRLEIAKDRDLAAHALEVVDRPLHPGGAGDGEKVQHRVGRAARRHDERDAVLDGR